MKQVFEIFWRFLLLGLTSFGGPAAHLGYFQKTFVQELRWIDQEAYARLIALSQFLPGPGSSQVGFALGLRKAGIGGGVAAFLGFTLPSFTLLYLLAVTSASIEHPTVNGIIQGLKLLAVIVVADATLNMSRNFCQENKTLIIAIATAVAMLLFPYLWVQMLLLLLAAVVGIGFSSRAHQVATSSEAPAKLPLFLFLALFLLLPLLSTSSEWLSLFNSFYHSGSLVFGGGHVVLPLLQQTLGDSVDADRFLLGYAAAQAIPGPMFTLATFLGAEVMEDAALAGALIATLGIFLPGFLLVLSLQSAWESWASQPKISAAAQGLNAAVVGLLLSALYQPVFSSAVNSSLDMALVIAGFIALQRFKLPVLILVLLFTLTGGLLL
ncbi:chromate efflux transporter [uncultured Neptuniibacter sp.]|uniref:chromate efflux transporter n=1 Tax=uncultured Neptuniibacter sp. TaxID=502143 RepID=UPI00261335DA|nr:chromate efflux transporter [uncultured Neptuniibacter sp.]